MDAKGRIVIRATGDAGIAPTGGWELSPASYHHQQ